MDKNQKMKPIAEKIKEEIEMENARNLQLCESHLNRIKQILMFFSWVIVISFIIAVISTLSK